MGESQLPEERCAYLKKLMQVKEFVPSRSVDFPAKKEDLVKNIRDN